jgi:hypothetical protein
MCHRCPIPRSCNQLSNPARIVHLSRRRMSIPAIRIDHLLAFGVGAMVSYAGRYSLSTTSISQGVLTDQSGTQSQVGCYSNSSGVSLCVQGAPINSIADSYTNGTIIVTYPNGQTLTCNPSDEATGPCGIGIP